MTIVLNTVMRIVDLRMYEAVITINSAHSALIRLYVISYH